MDLRQIIRENVEDFILDSIISEEIINEANRFKRFSNNSNEHSIKNKKRNLSQIKKNNETRRQKEKNKVDNDFGAKLADDGESSIGSGSDNRGKEIPVEEPKTGEDSQVNGGDNNVIPFFYDETLTNGDDGNGGNNYTTPTIDDETPNNSGNNNNGENGTAPNDQQQQQQTTAYFKPFADRLRQLIGTGFDVTPVQNNQAAVQHINSLNPFVYYIINAIESGNINSTASPAAGGSGGSERKIIDPYGKDGTDIALGAVNGAVGYTADKLNYLGQGQNNPFNGVFKAFGDAHNKTMNDVNGYLSQKKFNDAYGRNTQSVNTEAGNVSLTDLMQNIYPHLLEEYNKINTSYNGIFGSVPNVSNCHEVLQDLYSKVVEYNKQQQNTVSTNGNTEQPTNAPKTTNTTQTTPRGGVDNQNNERYYHNLAGKLKLSEKECHNLAAKNKVNHKFDGNVENALDWVGDLCQKVVSANDNKDRQSLMKLLSLDGKTYDDIPTYDTVNEIYNREYEIFEEEPGYKGILQNMKKAMTTLKQFRDQFMIDNRINNNR